MDQKELEELRHLIEPYTNTALCFEWLRLSPYQTRCGGIFWVCENTNSSLRLPHLKFKNMLECKDLTPLMHVDSSKTILVICNDKVEKLHEHAMTSKEFLVRLAVGMAFNYGPLQPKPGGYNLPFRIMWPGKSSFIWWRHWFWRAEWQLKLKVKWLRQEYFAGNP